MADTSRQPQIAIPEALHLLQTFRGADLTQTIYQIEKSVKGAGSVVWDIGANVGLFTFSAAVLDLSDSVLSPMVQFRHS